MRHLQSSRTAFTVKSSKNYELSSTIHCRTLLSMLTRTCSAARPGIYLPHARLDDQSSRSAHALTWHICIHVTKDGGLLLMSKAAACRYGLVPLAAIRACSHLAYTHHADLASLQKQLAACRYGLTAWAAFRACFHREFTLVLRHRFIYIFRTTQVLQALPPCGPAACHARRKAQPEVECLPPYRYR